MSAELKFDTDNVLQRFGKGQEKATVPGGILTFAFFVLSPVMFFIGFAEETYIVDTARDVTRDLCDNWNEPRNIEYIPRGDPASGTDISDTDQWVGTTGTDQKTCERYGCDWGGPGGNSVQNGQCCGVSHDQDNTKACTKDCGITANGYLHHGKVYNLGISQLAGAGASHKDCLDKANYDHEYNMAYLLLTMIVVGWYFFHTVLHMVLVGTEGNGKAKGIDNGAILNIFEFFAILLPLPLLGLSRVMPEQADRDTKMDQNPTAYIFMGWVFLICFIASHASIHGEKFGILSKSIGSSADGGKSGKGKGAKNRRVTSIHW